MGSKTLKFPKRKKYSAPNIKIEDKVKEKIVSEEEHQKRVRMLKEMGILE